MAGNAVHPATDSNAFQKNRVVGEMEKSMSKKRRSIVGLVVLVILIAFLGWLAVEGMPLWTPLEIVPAVDEITLGLDLSGGVRITYEADFDSAQVDNQSTSLDSAIQVIRNRLDSANYTEATISKQGSNRIVVEIPGVSNVSEISGTLITPAVLTFRAPDQETVLLEGSDVENATAAYDAELGYYVALEFTEEGRQKFADATEEYLEQVIYIYLDDEAISSPTVNDHITQGTASITGQFTQQQVVELANLIQSGALPVPLSQVATTTIGATLGAGSLERALIAGVVALVLIFLFMIIIYRLPGVLSCISLAAYAVVMVYALVAFDVTLTLPGIAGIILSLGMAVDANVVVFERIKEELAFGRTVGKAVDNGFKNAIKAVLDANITTIIAVIVLGIFGTGTIKGFAVTLGLGIVLSMLSQVVLNRALLKAMVNLNITKSSLYGLRKKKEAETNAQA